MKLIIFLIAFLIPTALCVDGYWTIPFYDIPKNGNSYNCIAWIYTNPSIGSNPNYKGILEASFKWQDSKWYISLHIREYGSGDWSYADPKYGPEFAIVGSQEYYSYFTSSWTATRYQYFNGFVHGPTWEDSKVGIIDLVTLTCVSDDITVRIDFDGSFTGDIKDTYFTFESQQETYETEAFTEEATTTITSFMPLFLLMAMFAAMAGAGNND